MDATSLWTAVDSFVDALQAPEPPAPALAARRAAQAGLPTISVTASLGRLLALLARLVQARQVLEIGTLGGYSTAWLCEGLTPGGRVTTIELDARHAQVARSTFAEAGIAGRIDLREGRALDVLRALGAERAGPFDLVFIDADKESGTAYFDLARGLCRPGAVIVIDNVIRAGAILDPGADSSARGSRAVLEHLSRTSGVAVSVLQTVGSKGHDGIAIAVVD